MVRVRVMVSVRVRVSIMFKSVLVFSIFSKARFPSKMIALPKCRLPRECSQNLHQNIDLSNTILEIFVHCNMG